MTLSFGRQPSNFIYLTALLLSVSLTWRNASGADPAVLDWARTPAKDAGAWPALVRADGRGLPPGEGTVAAGRALYTERCLRCHGAEGRGGPGGELAGGTPDLRRASPDLTIGSYWPVATTLFDFIRRAMPMDAPRSLDDEQVYALCAYLLHLNGLWPADGRLDAAALAALRMPNRLGFEGIEAPLPAVMRRDD